MDSLADADTPRLRRTEEVVVLNAVVREKICEPIAVAPFYGSSKHVQKCREIHRAMSRFAGLGLGGRMLQVSQDPVVHDDLQRVLLLCSRHYER